RKLARPGGPTVRSVSVRLLQPGAGDSGRLAGAPHRDEPESTGEQGSRAGGNRLQGQPQERGEHRDHLARAGRVPREGQSPPGGARVALKLVAHRLAAVAGVAAARRPSCAPSPARRGARVSQASRLAIATTERPPTAVGSARLQRNDSERTVSALREGGCSRMRKETTRPDVNVSPATSQMAARNPSASAQMPARRAPIA